jgi:hypothetical protein
MLDISDVLVRRKIWQKIQKLGLEKQYKKAQENILDGRLEQVDFKKRRPYKEEKYYFRLNKQSRLIGCFVGTVFHVFWLDDHSY